MNIELIKEKVRLVKLSHEGKSIIEIFRDLNFVIGYLDDNYPYINTFVSELETETDIDKLINIIMRIVDNQQLA